MSMRLALGFSTVALAVTSITVSSAGAHEADAAARPVLMQASALSPPRGGESNLQHGYLALHAREFARAKAAANTRAGVSGGGSAAAVAAAAPTVSSYANVSPSFEGDYETGSTPPDTTGAIGPDRYIEAINTRYAIHTRMGGLISSDSLSALTGIPTGFFGYTLSDPQMMWDSTTQRFYYAAVYFDSLFLSDNGIAVGWSKTATPSSGSDFCKYVLQFGGDLPDYPKLGDSGDFLLFGYNLFRDFATTYAGSAFAVVNKPPAGASCPDVSAFAVHNSGVLHNADGSLAATPVPANLVDDATGAGYVVADADLSVTPSADFVSVFSVTTEGVDPNGIPVPAISGPTNVAVPAYAMPANAPQQDSSYLLDTLDGRFEAAVAAVDPGHANTVAVWTAHAVYGGAGTEERWYEIDPQAGSLLQSGKVTSASLFAWNGTISPDRAATGGGAFGDSMAMSVSTSSATSYPAIQFVWKNGAGSQSGLTNLVQASGPNVDFSCSDTSACRWGDYSGASPDPAADGTFGKVWLANQFNLANGSPSSTTWRTWVFAVTPTSTAQASLAFATGAQTLTAGEPSEAMQVEVSSAPESDVAVSLGSSSSAGAFATSAAGPWSPTLAVTIPAGQTIGPSFYYRDTRAGSPTLIASASGATSATQSEQVNPAPLSTIAVSPGSATVNAGGTQLFAADGADAYGNHVVVSSATWSTTVAGASLSPTTGTSTTFTAGSTAGSGVVTAAIGAVAGQAAVTVTATTVPAPTGLTAAPRGKHIKLSWQASTGAVSYNVYRATASGGQGTTPLASGVTGTSFVDTSVASRTTYYYTVTAVGPNGTESTRSTEASAAAK